MRLDLTEADLKVAVAWDYEIMIFLQFYRSITLEDIQLEDEEFQERDYSDILEKMDQKQGTHNSLSELAFSHSNHDLGLLLIFGTALFGNCQRQSGILFMESKTGRGADVVKGAWDL